MTSRQSIRSYENLKPNEKVFFDRWVTANVVIASALALGLFGW